jgi:two-component system, NarL family, sensor kinase
MKKVLLLVIVMFSIVTSYCQSNTIDSLEKLTVTQKDTQLAATYNELTWQYRTINKDKAIEYGNKAIALATQLNYKKSIAQAYNDLGIIFYDKENYDSAISLYNKAIEIRKQLNDDLGIAKLYNKIGIVYQREGVFDKGLENQFAALKLFEKCNNDFGISYSLNNIGILNQNLGRYNEAIEYHKKSLAIKQKINDKIGAAASLINIGNIYFLNKRYVEAEKYFLQGVEATKQLGDNEYLSNALNNLGKLYIATKQYSKGIDVVNQSLFLRKELQDSKGTTSCYNNLGDIYFDLKNYKKADSIYTTALQIGTKAVNCLPEINSIYLSFSKLKESIGDTAAALHYYKLFSETKDSLYTDKVGETFADLETKYKTLEKEKEIEQKKFEITKRNYWIVGIGLLMLFGSVIIFGLYKRNKHKQQAKLQQEIMHQQELATKAVLIAEENERRRIATDLHDSIGQTMSAAKMNLSALKYDIKNLDESQKNAFETVINLVDNSCKEVRIVSHNMMPNALLKNGLANAIRAFLNQIDNRVIKIDLYTEGLNEKLDNNLETVLYRVVQECVNNVIKHSAANHLDISIIKDNDGLNVTIEDNGKGFDTADKNKFNGIGLKNIQSRIQFLKGTVEWQSQINKGTLVAIYLPV